MKQIKVNYLVQKKEYGDAIRTAEMNIDLTVSDSVYQELKNKCPNFGNFKVFRTLSSALTEIAKLQGYEFVSVESIEDVTLYV